jgi:hypothetical protein
VVVGDGKKDEGMYNWGAELINLCPLYFLDIGYRPTVVEANAVN